MSPSGKPAVVAKYIGTQVVEIRLSESSHFVAWIQAQVCMSLTSPPV